jgi:hypothetical protein
LKIARVQLFAVVLVLYSLLVVFSEAPQGLQVVEFSRFFSEDVESDIAKVHADPILALFSFNFGDYVARTSFEFVAFADELRHPDHVPVADAVDNAEIVDIFQLAGDFDDAQFSGILLVQDVDQVLDLKNTIDAS